VIEAIQHRCAQLVEPGERQLHVGLDAGRSRDAASGRALHQVLQQRGLADPRLAAQDQHLTLARPHARQQPIQRLALAAPATQPSPEVTTRHQHRRGSENPTPSSGQVRVP
jgi:hypothetical protein